MIDVECIDILFEFVTQSKIDWPASQLVLPHAELRPAFIIFFIYWKQMRTLREAREGTHPKCVNHTTFLKSCITNTLLNMQTFTGYSN